MLRIADTEHKCEWRSSYATTLRHSHSIPLPAGQPYPSHTNAFVKTHKVGVCRGPFPQPFIKAWKAWDKRNKSENDPIADHPKDQLYAIFAMADCGKDLEGYQLRGFDQARSMMLQVRLSDPHVMQLLLCS